MSDRDRTLDFKVAGFKTGNESGAGFEGASRFNARGTVRPDTRSTASTSATAAAAGAAIVGAAEEDRAIALGCWCRIGVPSATDEYTPEVLETATIGGISMSFGGS